MTARPPASLYNCLIRTHHITSRKKVQRVRRAAGQLGVRWVLIRSGGSPGMMYAESPDEEPLRDWMSAVQALRYKDFRCVSKPAPAPVHDEKDAGFDETGSMNDFAKSMDMRGVGRWFKEAMFG